MSVIPLSAAQKDGLAPDPDRVVEPIEQPGSFDNDKFNSVFESAWEKAEQSSKPLDAEVGGHIAAEPKGLDAKLKANFERAEAQEADRAEFNASRDARRELNERYGKQGDLSTHLEQFLGWVDNFRANPTMAGQAFAESYMRATPWGLKEQKEKPPVDDPYGAHKLNDMISDAIDNASAEKKDLAATAAQRAKLKEVFPGMTFDEAMARVVQIDREMHQNPLDTAGKLAAAFGMPVTPRQVEQDRHVSALGAAIDRALPTMPNFQMEPVMNVLRDPKFQRSADPVADLQRAYAVSEGVSQYMVKLGNAAVARLAQLPPELAREVESVINSPEFQKLASQSSPFAMDGQHRLEQAIGMAHQRLAARGVNRAKRAAPVRSRSTHTTKSGSSSGLDAIIGNALAKY